MLIYFKGATSSMIETKGYVLMAYLDLYTKENDGTKKSELEKKINDLKDWLLSQRKGNGFFSSTQVKFWHELNFL